MNTFFNRLLSAQNLGVSALMAALLLPTAASAQQNSTVVRPVVAYVDTTTPSKTLTQVPWEQVTHVNIAFAGINAKGMCAWMDPSGKDVEDTSGTMPKIIKKLIDDRNARNPSAKLMLSVGGWTMSYRFTGATQNPLKTQRLAKSCVKLVNDLGLDGVDYDWEYPTKLGKKNCPAGMVCADKSDPQRLTSLLQTTRAMMGPDTINHPLTVAVFMTPGSRGIPYDVAGMDKALTFWNIMAYDAAAPNWSEGTGFHSSILESQTSLFDYVKAGATPTKLNLGVPYYGYIWKNVPSVSVGTPAPGNENNWSQYSTLDIAKRYSGDGGCKLYSDRHGEYFFCATGEHKGEWAAIDNEATLSLKARFVRENNFGGVMMWAVQTDSAQGTLTRVLYDQLNGAHGHPLSH
jgi:chitinase